MMGFIAFSVHLWNVYECTINAIFIYIAPLCWYGSSSFHLVPNISVADVNILWEIIAACAMSVWCRLVYGGTFDEVVFSNHPVSSGEETFVDYYSWRIWLLKMGFILIEQLWGEWWITRKEQWHLTNIVLSCCVSEWWTVDDDDPPHQS